VLTLRPVLSQGKRHRAAVLLILLIAAVFRAWLIATDGVSFDSDEAIVGLMARHITQGHSVPTFFYGQDYMGSLDAILSAAGFRVFGESMHTLRVVQMILSLLSLAVAYRLAYEITRSRRVAGMALLLLALPTALGTLYTAIAIGGYNETVLFGSLVLLLSWQVTVGGRRELWRWAVLGLGAGIGWWSNGSIVTACAVAGLLGLGYFSPRQWRGYVLVGIAFLVGSAPWWIYNLRHDWAALRFLTGGFKPTPGVEPISPGESVIALLVLGLPALYGLRFPWEAGFSVTPGIAAGAAVYLVLVADVITGGYGRLRSHLKSPYPRPFPRKQRKGEAVFRSLSACGEGFREGLDRSLRNHSRGVSQYTPAYSYRWLWLVFGVFAAVFTLSPFSDATGRYLMPVWVPAAIGIALGLERLRRAGWMVPALAIGVLLTAQAGSVIHAARTDTGLTPQLVERLRTPAGDDQTLLRFLTGQGYTRGYASYWTSFRITFRSREAVIFDTSLPHDERGAGPGANRYKPYVSEVAAAERVMWITQNFPELDTLITRRLAEAGITCQTRDIGRYRVYYAFSRRVAPEDLGLTGRRPLGAQDTE
jgi:hypothetical protein